MRGLVLTAVLCFSISSCAPTKGAVQAPESRAATENAKTPIWVNSSQLVGSWRLTELQGLNEAYAQTEAQFANKGETILWDPAAQTIGLSYKVFPLRRQTWVTVHGANPHITVYDGNLKNGFESLTLLESLPSTLLYATSKVRDSSGQVEPTGPAPIMVATGHFLTVQPDIRKTVVSDYGLLRTQYGENDAHIARFKRAKAK